MASYWKPHLTRQLPLEIGPQATTASLSVVPATGSSWTTTLGNDMNYGAPGASTLRTAAMLGVGSTAVSNGNPVPVSDAGGSLTVDGSVAVTTTAATFQSAGELAGTALTGSYQTVLTLGANAACLIILNTCNNTILVSLDSGSTDSLKLETGESLTLDFATNGRHVASGATIQVKHAGAAPTQGTIRVSRIG